jgi:hypothetical protein
MFSRQTLLRALTALNNIERNTDSSILTTVMDANDKYIFGVVPTKLHKSISHRQLRCWLCEDTLHIKEFVDGKVERQFFAILRV